MSFIYDVPSIKLAKGPSELASSADTSKIISLEDSSYPSFQKDKNDDSISKRIGKFWQENYLSKSLKLHKMLSNIV